MFFKRLLLLSIKHNSTFISHFFPILSQKSKEKEGTQKKEHHEGSGSKNM